LPREFSLSFKRLKEIPKRIFEGKDFITILTLTSTFTYNKYFMCCISKKIRELILHDSSLSSFKIESSQSIGFDSCLKSFLNVTLGIPFYASKHHKQNIKTIIEALGIESARFLIQSELSLEIPDPVQFLISRGSQDMDIDILSFIAQQFYEIP
jgi:hypothetical protein